MGEKTYYEIINWSTVQEDCQYEDDNNGYIYGLYYIDKDGQIMDAEWFRTEEERISEIVKLNNDGYREINYE